LSHCDLRQPSDQPWGPPGPGRNKLGQALGEDPARAAPLGAEELSDPELSHDVAVCPREIREGALIATVDASRRHPAPCPMACIAVTRKVTWAAPSSRGHVSRCHGEP
jgi:hypothetical protein